MVTDNVRLAKIKTKIFNFFQYPTNVFAQSDLNTGTDRVIEKCWGRGRVQHVPRVSIITAGWKGAPRFLLSRDEW